MKDHKLIRWAEDKAEELQEISEEISWEGKRAIKTVKSKAIEAGRKLKENLKMPSEPCRKPAGRKKADTYVPEPWEEQKELTEKMDRAIHRAYYKEGGFRYFGCALLRYVKVDLPKETDVASACAAGYNSCISPMLLQLEKLEEELMTLESESDQEPLGLKNAELLHLMQSFELRALMDKLHFGMGIEMKEYREALRRYAQDLDAQLLTPYQPPQQYDLMEIREAWDGTEERNEDLDGAGYTEE